MLKNLALASISMVAAQDWKPESVKLVQGARELQDDFADFFPEAEEMAEDYYEEGEDEEYEDSDDDEEYDEMEWDDDYDGMQSASVGNQVFTAVLTIATAMAVNF